MFKIILQENSELFNGRPWNTIFTDALHCYLEYLSYDHRAVTTTGVKVMKSLARI